MSKPERLPKHFEPFHELIVCSNTAIDGFTPFRVLDVIPLLVGKGPTPRVWLNMLSGLSVVSDNCAKLQNIKVEATPSSVTVLLDTNVILKVVKLADDRAEVMELDLRPLGFDIHGNEQGLSVGPSRFEGNSVTNVHTMFRFG